MKRRTPFPLSGFIPAFFILMLCIPGLSRGQYNAYETQAGTVVMTPPRHHTPKTPRPASASDNYVVKIETQPEFPGGPEAMNLFLAKNLKYPAKARSLKIQGKVFVGFMVRKDSTLSDVQAMRGIGCGCDEEAVRLVRSMPKWKPAEADGQAIDAVIVIPVRFELEPVDQEKK